VVILVSVVLQQRRTDGYSAARIMRLVGISRHTLKRWIHYFNEIFPVSRRWQQVRGMLGMDLIRGTIPSSLVLFFIKRFGFTEGLIRSLQLFLGGSEMF